MESRTYQCVLTKNVFETFEFEVIAMFQFVNDTFTNISLELKPDDINDAYNAVIAELTDIYGEATINTSSKDVILSTWELQNNDTDVLLGVINRVQDDVTVSFNVQVSYLHFPPNN